jgi:hypothetical protein
VISGVDNREDYANAAVSADERKLADAVAIAVGQSLFRGGPMTCDASNCVIRQEPVSQVVLSEGQNFGPSPTLPDGQPT